jgi:fumarylacetoacetase
VPGVAIGDRVVDLRALAAARVLSVPSLPAVWAVNDIARLPRTARRDLRHALFALFLEDNHSLRDNPGLLAAAVHFQRDVTFHLPCAIANYTDFYASVYHATNVGSMFRPDNPLLPNYRWVPIGYHGRASSIGVSGQSFVRPIGQTLPPGATVPVVRPSRRVDYEMELGVFIGPVDGTTRADQFGQHPKWRADDRTPKIKAFDGRQTERLGPTDGMEQRLGLVEQGMYAFYLQGTVKTDKRADGYPQFFSEVDACPANNV